MGGLLAIVVLIVAGYLGWIAILWYWCILLAAINIPIYYSVKPEGKMAADVQSFGVPKWLVWIVLSNIFTVSVFYGLGYLFGQVLL